jgi:hypothetical protein
MTLRQPGSSGFTFGEADLKNCCIHGAKSHAREEVTPTEHIPALRVNVAVENDFVLPNFTASCDRL